MRIAIINEKWTAGATRCARDLQHGLAARHVVQYFPEEKVLTVEEQLYALRGFRPDVVHLHSFYGDLPYSFLGEVAALYPTVLTLHDPRPVGNVMLQCWNCEEYGTCFRCPLVGTLKRYTLVRHDYFRQRLEKRRVHARLPGSTQIVCVSDWMRRRVLNTELARLPVTRIHNGVDLDVFRRDPAARAALGIPAGAPVLTYLAHHSGWSVDKRKGGHILAQALAEIVIPRFPQLVVLAVGGGMIPNLPNVRPVGFVSPQDVARYYSAADIFVAPSLGDNLPYTVIEAMGCEVPVVASRVGGIPEEIDDNVTGRLFAPGSWQELGSTLVSMLEQPEKSAAMGRAGRKRAEEHFELSAFVGKYESLFASLLPAPAAMNRSGIP
jgi:glycosyltransferase involved in cell wall biosynthesis